MRTTLVLLILTVTLVLATYPLRPNKPNCPSKGCAIAKADLVLKATYLSKYKVRKAGVSSYHYRFLIRSIYKSHYPNQILKNDRIVLASKKFRSVSKPGSTYILSLEESSTEKYGVFEFQACDLLIPVNKFPSTLYRLIVKSKAYSNPSWSSQCNGADGGKVFVSDGTEEYSACVGNVVFGVKFESTSKFSYFYVITDDSDRILAYYNSADTTTLDLSRAAAGVCRVYGWSYRGTQDPVVGQDIRTLDDEKYEDISSNYITVYRQVPDGGEVLASDGSDYFVGCAGDVVVDVIHITNAPNLDFVYVITDSSNNILSSVDSADSNTLDFSSAPPGVCRIWGWSSTGEQELVLGADISTLGDEECESLSESYVAVTREIADAGEISNSQGKNYVTGCAGAIVIDVVHTTTSEFDYFYVVTDDTNTILEYYNSLEMSRLDLSIAAPGECRIYGYSNFGNEIVAGENISTLGMGSCEAVTSKPIIVTRRDCSKNN